MRLPNGEAVPRTLETYIRYPALGPATERDLPKYVKRTQGSLQRLLAAGIAQLNANP